MSRLPFLPVVAALLAVLLPGTAGAAAKKDPAFEERIRAELERLAPEARPLLDQADAAREASDWPIAEARYREVVEKAPGFSHGWRRLCGAHMHQGHDTQGREACRKALDLERSAENLSAYANVLARSSDWREAYRLGAEAAGKDPASVAAQVALCNAQLEGRNLGALDTCSQRLIELEPENPLGHYFLTLLHANARHFGDARTALEEARRVGLPEGDYHRLAKMLDESEPPANRYGRWVLRVAEAWVGLAVLLIVLGWVLSALTLRTSRNLPAQATGRAVGISARLRRAYAAVLWLACAYYYVSIPLVLLTVVVGGGGIIYGLLSVGSINVKLLAIVAVVVLATLWAVLKSVFVRATDEDPGMVVDLGKQARLGAVISEVAGKVGIPVVDRVFLTPGTELAVFERGGLLEQLGRSKERCLILGAAALDGMPVPAFKAILAHEFGHLSNEDTAGGGFALAVRRSLFTMADSLAEQGAATWYNPAWLFLNGFYRVFLLISHGASRLQEVLADRWAALCYGAEAFERGLRHVIEKGISFDAHATATLREVVEGEKALPNLYRYEPATKAEPKELDQAIAEAVDRKASAYDSHPAPQERFALVRKIGGPAFDANQGTAWELFEDREALERELTDVIRTNVALNLGVQIPKEAPAPAPGTPAT